MVPFLHDPGLRTRRPLLFESFVETSDVDQQGGAETPSPPLQLPRPPRRDRREAAGAAPRPRSSPRRKTTRESASGPTSTSPGRRGRRSSTTSTRTRTSSTTWSRSPTTSRSATTSTRCSTGGVDEEGGLEDCVGRTCSEPAAKIPLDRIELRRVRKEEREEKEQERREKREAREQREQERREEREEREKAHTPPLAGRGAASYLITARTSPLATAVPSERSAPRPCRSGAR